MECLEQEYDSFNLHKQIKALTGGHSIRSNNSILDKHNTMLFKEEKILEMWKEYMEKLFEEEQEKRTSIIGKSRPETRRTNISIKKLKNKTTKILKLFRKRTT